MRVQILPAAIFFRVFWSIFKFMKKKIKIDVSCNVIHGKRTFQMLSQTAIRKKEKNWTRAPYSGKLSSQITKVIRGQKLHSAFYTVNDADKCSPGDAA